jgi:hypothetical protein
MNVCELAPINIDGYDSLLVASRQISQLRAQGFSLLAIAKMVGLSPDPDRAWDDLTFEVAKLLEAEHSDAIEVPVSMVVAARQCLRFRKLGFDVETARLVCGLPRKDGVSWDKTMEDIARVWEELDSVKKANAAETPRQKTYTH